MKLVGFGWLISDYLSLSGKAFFSKGNVEQMHMWEIRSDQIGIEKGSQAIGGFENSRLVNSEKIDRF